LINEAVRGRLLKKEERGEEEEEGGEVRIGGSLL
jgi:hypothetical protein